jgi:hypothetical protein
VNLRKAQQEAVHSAQLKQDMLPASAVVKGKVPADFLPFQIDPWRLVADDRRAARTPRFHNYVAEVLSACWKKKEVVFREFVPRDLIDSRFVWWNPGCIMATTCCTGIYCLRSG